MPTVLNLRRNLPSKGGFPIPNLQSRAVATPIDPLCWPSPCIHPRGASSSGEIAATATPRNVCMDRMEPKTSSSEDDMNPDMPSPSTQSQCGAVRPSPQCDGERWDEDRCGSWPTPPMPSSPRTAYELLVGMATPPRRCGVSIEEDSPSLNPDLQRRERTPTYAKTPSAARFQAMGMPSPDDAGEEDSPNLNPDLQQRERTPTYPKTPASPTPTARGNDAGEEDSPSLNPDLQ